MTEKQIIEYEEELNKAMDQYFKARLHFFRTVQAEKIFEGGFRMAWRHMKNIDSTQG